MGPARRWAAVLELAATGEARAVNLYPSMLRAALAHAHRVRLASRDGARSRRQHLPISVGIPARPVDWIRHAWGRFDQSRSLGLAAEMAFWLFLSLLPLAVVVGLVTAKAAVENAAVATPLLASLPHATRELVGDELGRVAAWNGGQVGVEAGLVFVWLASSGVHSLFDGIELEIAQGAPRPWWRKRLLAIAACVALSLGTSLLAMLGTGLGRLWRLAGGAPIDALDLESSTALEIGRLALGAALSLGLVAGLYRVARPPGVPASVPIVPGALLAVVLQIALGFAYALYIQQMGDGGAYLAGLASIGVTLMALYLFCLALLGGVQLNQIIGERRQAAAIRDRARSKGERAVDPR